MNVTNLQSVCILGRQPALGLAELESLYGATHLTKVAPQVAALDLHASDINFSWLGGSTRLAHVMAILPTNNWKVVEKALPELTVELALTLPDGKIQLGLSAFDFQVSASKLNAVGLTLKKVLRSKLERSVRVTPNPELELNTAQVLHNHLTGPTGIELLIIAGSNGQTIIARTTEVQDIDSYSLRDRGRPKRDARVGMLPPKLAQIIINLAGKHLSPDATIDRTHSLNQNPLLARLLDPFCGTGVVLQEALLLGYEVIGTDLEQRMIDYTRENLDWANEHLGIVTARVSLEQGDATTHQWSPGPDLVAGETYLGRPFTDRPSAELVAQTSNEVNLILKKFLQNIHDQLAEGTRLCLAVPAWQISRNQFKYLPLIDQISDLDYNRVRFEHVRDTELLYYREDQIVARQILVLTRK